MARILVADDEEGVRSFIAEALEVEGHLVTTAADGAEAARLLAKQGVDLLVTDLRMPGMDGLTLLRKVREEQPDVEVVVLTAVGSVESAVSAMKAGAFEYLLKPVGSPAELRLTVARALERRALLNFRAEARQSTGSVVLSWGSPAMGPVVEALRKVAPTQATVLLVGESGTGKEVAARALHQWSERSEGPFVAVNCAALTETLLESELFGHEKGAFTGAVSGRPGAFERAHGGTIFLDELGELRLDLQPKLLRVLENHEVRRVGGNDVIEVSCRVIAATNRDLMKEIQAGNFREDLYFRLSVITIQLPPLRQRRDDIPLILKEALADPEVVLKHGKKRFSPEAMGLLMSYAWPGNVRELMNVLSHVLTFSEGEEIQPAHLPPRVRGQTREGPLPFNEHLSFKDAKEQLLENFEREYVTSVLTRCEGNLSRAARESGLHRKSIERLVKKYQLDTKGMKPR